MSTNILTTLKSLKNQKTKLKISPIYLQTLVNKANEFNDLGELEQKNNYIRTAAITITTKKLCKANKFVLQKL